MQVASDAVADLRVVDPDRSIDFEGKGPIMVNGDDARLRQVAANLMSNARLHTPGRAPVHVSARLSGHAALLAQS